MNQSNEDAILVANISKSDSPQYHIKEKRNMDSMLEKVYSMTNRELEECAAHLTLGGGTRGGPVLDHGKGVLLCKTS